MAKSPANEIWEVILNLVGGVGLIDIVNKFLKGEALPENAPLVAKMAVGLMGSGDEVAQHLILEALAKSADKDPDPEAKKEAEEDRNRILRFLLWLRNQGGEIMGLTTLVAWYYFNGFRVKLAKMHASTAIESKGKKDDLGVMFLQRIADIIKKKPDDEKSTYPEVLDFLKTSGVPVMPNLEFINKFKTWILGVPQRIAAYDQSVKTWYEELGERNGQRSWPMRQLLRLMGEPVTKKKKGSRQRGNHPSQQNPNDELSLHSPSVVLNIQTVQTVNINKEK